MNGESNGDVHCLKNQPFCPYKSVDLMDYSENKAEKLRADYSSDIKSLSCGQIKNKSNDKKVIKATNREIEHKIMNGELIDRKLLENKRVKLSSINDSNNGSIDKEPDIELYDRLGKEKSIIKLTNENLTDLDSNLDNRLNSNLIVCNSTNVFHEIDEDVLETETTSEKTNVMSNQDINPIVTQPSSNLLDSGLELSRLDSLSSNDSSLAINGQGMISTQKTNLIDKKLISLATQKLLQTSELGENKVNKSLMQIEDLECILNNKSIDDLHENSRELIEQLSEHLNEQLNEQIEIMSSRQIDQNEKSNEDEKPTNDHFDEIQLIKEQLIEQPSEPAIEQICNEFNLLNHLEQNDSQTNNSQYYDETGRESQNTTPVDSEYSFKYSLNRALLKDNSADYEEVFDDSYYDDDLNNSDESYLDRLKRLEEEQETLNSSLIALTSHFAQVQLRLKQIVDASPESKETLLKDLEEFAFRGIPDYRLPELEDFSRNSKSTLNESQAEDDDQKQSKLELQRSKQKELILKLKEQLEDLEKYAYETGDPNIVPSSMIMERQSVIIEELKGKLPLELDKLEKMSPEDLRKQIDKAIRDLVNPVIMKSQLVDQLKTQVSDLERFIEFLQEGKICIRSSSKKGGFIFDGNVNHLIAKCKCNCTSKHSQECVSNGNSKMKKDSSTNGKQNCKNKSSSFTNRSSKCKANGGKEDDLNDNEKAARMIRRALALLQMFTFVHFGCNTKSMTHKAGKFERNTLKKTNKHWGDLRAKLEVTIDHLIELTKQKQIDSDYTSECEESILIQTNEKITNTVRKQLCPLLRDLLEHGLITSLNGCVSSDDRVMNQNDYSFMSWNCFSQRSRLINLNDRRVTIWDILINYFYLKKGDRFRQTPARKLSLSFNLDIVGGVPITPKQTLLSCIDEIMDTHTKLKRSADSHFKAFISRALNEKRLISWLKLIFKCNLIVKQFYEPWSYVSNSTALDEGLKSLDRLTSIDWQLPTDIAIRQLQNINDAF